MPERVVRSVCPHDCPDTCGCLTTVADGRVVGFAGDPSHPVTRGWLCAKVNDYLEFTEHPERLLAPLRRVSGKHEAPRFEPVSWDEALAEIATRWQAIIDRHGAEAILPYSFSGTLGLVQMTVCSERFWNRLGASRLRRSICGAAAETAVELTLGARLAPPYEHVRDSRLCIIWGNNPHSTAPHFMPFLRDAQRAGCEVWVIDPRRTRTARSADRHLAPLPASDAALALGMAHVILRDGLEDRAWLARHAHGVEAFAARAAEYPPERVAAITGLAAEDVVTLARRYAGASPALIKINDGINRNLNGGQSTRAVACLPALTGQYGRRGGGLAYSAGQSVRWDADAVGRPEGCPPPAREVNMNRLGAALCGELREPPIQALYVFGANPAASTPNAGKVAEGLRRPDLFTVVHELFMTDTARLADIVLPATSQLEHVDLHKASGHHLLAYNHAARGPLGEARSNWDTLRALAAAMGMDHPSLREDADRIIDDVLAATAAGNPRLDGITGARLRREGWLPLAMGDAVPFADGAFTTPSGRVELRCERMAEHGADPLPAWRDVEDRQPPTPDRPAERALLLLSPASHHLVSSSFGNRAALLRREREPTVELHPDDAAARGIADGDRVRIENARGWCELRATLSDDLRPGVAVSTKGRWCAPQGGRNVNWTTPDALADIAGQSTFQSNRVWVERVPAATAERRTAALETSS